jgi:hypothetical protein
MSAGVQVRKLRHWKQQFNPNARFVLRRPLTIYGEDFPRGHVLSDELVTKIGPTKIRRWWESRTIELAEFSEPRYQPEPHAAPEPAREPVSGDVAEPQGEKSHPENGSVESSVGASENGVEKIGGGYYRVTIDGETRRVRGSDAVTKLWGGEDW